MRHNNKSDKRLLFKPKFWKFFDSMSSMEENNNSFKLCFIVAIYDFVDKMIALLSKSNKPFIRLLVVMVSIVRI